MKYVIDKAEVMRYLGSANGRADAETERLIDECAAALAAAAKPKYIYKLFDIEWKNGEPTISGCSITLKGSAAAEWLSGCTGCAILGATLGLEADTAIRRAQTAEMSRAVVLNACATDMIEKVCDRAQAEIAELAAQDGFRITDRFSPGYGDLSVEYQRNICAILELDKKIGVFLTDELLLIPTKSVTAIVGIGEPSKRLCRGCMGCNLREKCRFRKQKGEKTNEK